jgi:uncharacterized membrane protein YbhN (UPF0104 family)
MRGHLKKILKYLLSMSLAVVLMWFSFREVQWQDFLESLKQCRWEFVLLSMAAGALAFLLCVIFGIFSIEDITVTTIIGIVMITVGIVALGFVEQREDEDLKYEQIKDSRFKQQRLPAWRPVPTIMSIVIVFSAFGIVFIILGIVLLAYSAKVKSHEIDYTNCDSDICNKNFK